ncbi:MAG: hypothetical protein KAR47_20160, partial [Planctomycetes bacterium]|nr:hypothetical protein [Planctomycetota bacterium]
AINKKDKPAMAKPVASTAPKPIVVVDRKAAPGVAPTKPKPSRLNDAADRVIAVVGSALGSDGLQPEATVMKDFNEQFGHFQDDAPACDVCGSICVRNGTCYRCFNCGNSMGCS